MDKHFQRRWPAVAGALGFALLSVPAEVDAAVGRIEAAFGVGINGTPTYIIPIQATEGIGGMTPRLAVAYGMPNKKGILGTGFALSGLSKISPCPKTTAQDTTPGPVKLESGDRYCLDGARLRLASAGTYGDSNTVYRTEVDQLARITAYSSTNSVPGHFKVETRDGLKYEYGNTADSLMRTSTGANARTQFWALSKISDRSDNTITFNYDNDDDAHLFRPSLIQYTNRFSALDGNYTIGFVYQASDQPDPSTERVSSAGEAAELIQNRLLQRIELKHQGSIYRQYLFNYETSPAGNSRIVSVEECAVTTGDCLPETVFGWEDATAGHASGVASGGAASSPQPLDLNNDGFEDVVWAEAGSWRYMLGTASGHSGVFNTSITATNPTKAMVLDWDGDGFDDLLIDWSDSKWRVLRGTATGLASAQHAGPGTGIPSNTGASGWWVADINGDRRDDLLRIRTTTTQPLKIWVRLGDSTGFGAETVALDSGYFRPASQLFGAIAEKNRSSTRRADFNGDGREDLLVRACEWEPTVSLCIWTGWFQLYSAGSSLVEVAFGASDATSSERPLLANFNADNLTDFVYRCQFTGQWCAMVSKGEGGYTGTYGPSHSGYLSYLYLVGDYDGDGFDDLYAAKAATGTWDIIPGSGSGLTNSTTSTSLSTAGSSWAVTDHNGDSLSDLGYFSSSFWRTNSHSGVPGDILASATDGLGNAVSFAFLPMSNSTVYTRGSGAIFPVQEFSSSASLVRGMTVMPGGGTPYSIMYSYANARFHAQGRGHLGMGSTKVNDERNDVSVERVFEQTFPYSGAIKSSTSKQSNGALIQVATHTYAMHTLDATSNNQRFLPYRSQIETNVYEVGGLKNGLLINKITSDHTVNTLGNSTFTSTTSEDKDAGSTEYGSVWTTEVTATFSENTADWCLALPITRSEKRILPNGVNETRAASWDPDTSNCRVTKETVAPGAGSALSLVTDVGYDDCGNVNSLSSYPAGQSGLARPTTIGYGTRCQLPESITNPLDQTSSIAYDWPLALPSSHTDLNGIETGLIYDGFGRLTQRNNPDLTDVVFSLTACTAGNGWCGKTSAARMKVTQIARTTSDDVIRTEEQFLDGSGQVRWSHSDSLESGPAVVATLYDAFGRPTVRSQPYFLGGSIYWTQITYDLIGRPTQQDAAIDESNVSGRITEFKYEGRELRITDPRTFITTRRSNAIGQLESVVDPSPGGTTNYAYHPFGEIASITDEASNATSWVYNERGFVTSTSDPDSGTSTFVPNAFGDTEFVRDAKTTAPAWTTQFTFDKLSRPLTRIDLLPAGTTYFTYGNSAAAKNIGKLASVASPGNYSEVYSFDSFGRLSQQSVTADGTTYNFNLAYVPATGLLDTLEYPVSTSSYRLKLSHEYSNGQLKRVKNANSAITYWEAVSTDAFGHIQDELFGNGVRTVTDFDQASGLMSSRQAGVGGGTGLINAEVAWDPNGNLTTRTESALSSSVTENFYYDSLNRFDYSQRNGATNADVTLDAIGNILWKKDVCPTDSNCYTYHAAQKRAVVTAGSNTYGYDAAGNMTSRNGSSISYTSYNLPFAINAGTSSSSLYYGAFRNRYKQVAVSGGSTETTIYVAGLLEKVTRGSITEYRHTIRGGQGTAAIYTRRSDSTNSTYYVHKDHLGSPELVTKNSGAVLLRPSFGAYGERRDGTDWNGPPSAGNLNSIADIGRRGFTGHEHLDAVGLIHMNGRVYDPVAGRFLGVDPIVQLGSSQSPNSYAYVWNNPLTFTDPSGFDPEDVVDRPSFCRIFPHLCRNGDPPGTIDERDIDIWDEYQRLRELYEQQEHDAPPQDWGSFGGPGAMYGAGSTVGGTQSGDFAVPYDPPIEPVYPLENAALFFAAGGWNLVRGVYGIGRVAVTQLGRAVALRWAFSASERAIIREATSILTSSEFAALRAAHAAGQSLTVNIGGRVVQYEAGWAAEGFSLGHVNGFLLGPRAFASPAELARTVAHELYRLQSGTLGYAEAGTYATRATQAAFEFAQRAAPFLPGVP